MKPYRSHDEALAESLRNDPEFAAALAEAEQVTLSPEESRRFVEDAGKPFAPNEKLAKALGSADG